MDKLPMTAAGHAALEAEFLRRQQVERPRIIAAISEARSHGDLSENAEYHSAKEAQSHNEGRIVELEDMLQRAEVIDVSKLSGSTIKFGATVTLIDEDTEVKKSFQIVGEAEADGRAGKVSVTSPTARALIGKKVGDTVEVNTPGGGKGYEILKIVYRKCGCVGGLRTFDPPGSAGARHPRPRAVRLGGAFADCPVDVGPECTGRPRIKSGD